MRTEGRMSLSWTLIYDLTFPISPFAFRRRRHIIQLKLIRHRARASRTRKLRSAIAPALSGAKFIDFSHHLPGTHTAKWTCVSNSYNIAGLFIIVEQTKTHHAITNFVRRFHSFRCVRILKMRWHCMREKQFLARGKGKRPVYAIAMMPVFSFEPMCRQPSHQMRLIIFVLRLCRCTKESHLLHSRSARRGICASKYANGTSPFSSLSDSDTRTISFVCLCQWTVGLGILTNTKWSARRETNERTVTWIVHWNKSVEIPKATFDANSLVFHGSHAECRYLPSNHIYDLMQCNRSELHVHFDT